MTKKGEEPEMLQASGEGRTSTDKEEEKESIKDDGKGTEPIESDEVGSEEDPNGEQQSSVIAGAGQVVEGAGDFDEKQDIVTKSAAPKGKSTTGEKTNAEQRNNKAVEFDESKIPPQKVPEENDQDIEVPPSNSDSAANKEVISNIGTRDDISEQDTQSAGSSRRRSHVICLFLMLLIVVIALQGVVIGLLLSNNDDENEINKGISEDSRQVPGDSVSLPSAIPTFQPSFTLSLASIAPSNSLEPSQFPTATLGTAFFPLSDSFGSDVLSIVSSCDDCSERIELPFNYPIGDDEIRILEVDSNGRIYFIGCTSPTGFCGTLSVIDSDLDPSVQGSIHTLFLSELRAFVISWENIPFWTFQDTFVNGQAYIFEDGSLSICWGEGRVNSGRVIRAGFELERQEFSFFPAVGPQFDGTTGETFDGQYPANTCQNIIGTGGPPVNDSLPTTYVSDLYFKPFESLRANPRATRLEVVSSGDDVEEQVVLNTPIPWYGNSVQNLMRVSSNGFILLGDCLFTGERDCSVIDVASADLNPADRGDVYFFDAFASNSPANSTRRLLHNKSKNEQRRAQVNATEADLLYIISWENTVFFSSSLEFVNAQARFYANGTTELCWGEASDRVLSIQAGINAEQFNVYAPAFGGPFGLDGFTEDGEWPTNLCQQFGVAGTAIPPVSFPTPVPFPTSAPMPPPRDCVATIGSCASDMGFLMRYAALLGPGDTLAICGEIELPSPLTILEPNVTVCCEDNSRCVLRSTGQDRLMVVSAPNVTLKGLAFEGGAATFDDGGNVLVDFPGIGGRIDIANCAFFEGVAVRGGNLYIRNAPTVVISNSIFAFGTADEGGGIAIENTQNLVIQESFVESNRCLQDGGGMLVFSTADVAAPGGTNIAVVLTRFDSNSAQNGGGAVMKNLTGTVRVRVYDSFFADNRAVLQGAAAALFYNTTTTTLNAILLDNEGSGNNAFNGDCDNFYVEIQSDATSVSNCGEINEPIFFGTDNDNEGPPAIELQPASLGDGARRRRRRRGLRDHASSNRTSTQKPNNTATKAKV